MDESAAKAWMADLGVSRETSERIDQFVALLRKESVHQNLVSAASLNHVFARHIVDSAQLWRLAPDATSWIDLGSGAGLPGLIIAMLGDAPITLVESRRLRADWLRRTADVLGLTNVTVELGRLEILKTRPVGVITARAFAPLPKLFALAHRFSTEETRWILPKGRSAAEELASIAATWHGSFHMEPSVTDPDSAILIARYVMPKRIRL
jgi:16S rRNA (guanine527-N7)-methyltransferase